MARGVTIREQALGGAPIEALDISTIAIVGTAPGITGGDFVDEKGNIKYNEPFLLTQRGDAPANDFGDEGTLPLALDTIYAQGGATVAIVIVEHTATLTDEVTIADVATKLVATVNELKADGDFAVTTDVANQLSISFYSLTGTNLENIQNSGRGRLFTVGTSGPTYAVDGSYIPRSKRIPVTLESGTLPAPGQVDLSIAVQTAHNGEAENRTAATGVESDPNNNGEPSGVYAFVNAESVVGRRPRLIGAPGIDTGSIADPSGTERKNPLATALEIVARKLRGIAYLDGPNTTHADALKYAKYFSTARTYLLDPGALVTNANGELVDAALSGFALGLTARVDTKEGWWNLPSNRPILGIQALKRPVGYNPNDANSRAVLLNANAVTTVIRYQGGFRLFGTRTPASTDPAFKFLNVRRIADNIEDSVQEAMFYHIDKNINKNFLRAVTNRANGFLRNMVSLGALIGAECYPDGELNTKDSIALGKIYFNVKFTPPYPAEEIIFTFDLVNDYLTSISL